MTEKDDTKKEPLQSILINHPEFITAIGLISIEVNNLETMLAALLGAVLRIYPDVSSVIYLTPKASSARLDILENITQYVLKETDGRKTIEGIIKRARNIFNKRHMYVHSTWGTEDDKVSRRDTPHADKNKVIAVEIKELNVFVNDIRLLIEDVAKTMEKMYALISSQHKSS